MKISKTTWGILLAILLSVLLVWILSPILTPFVVSFILAYLLNPLVEKLIKRRWHRTTAVSLVIGSFMFLIIGLFLIFVPIVQTQVLTFSNKIPYYVQNISTHLRSLTSFLQEKIPSSYLNDISYSTVTNTRGILSAFGNVLLHIVNGGIGLFNILALLLIIPVCVFYLLLDWEEIKRTLYGLIPPRWHAPVKENMNQINTTLSAFIRGQLSVCLALSLFYAITLSLAGLELGSLIGLLAGILSFIPYIGFTTGLILSILLAFSQQASLVLWIALAVIFTIGQILESYILTPHFVGKNIGLHPVWIIFILIAGGYLFGFLGILLAVPVASIARLFLLKGIAYYQQTQFYKQKK